jgi:alkaline phosphatase D
VKLSRRALLGTFAAAPFVRGQPLSPAFPQGVASGDPSDSGVVLWTRIAPETHLEGQPLIVEISATPDFGEIWFRDAKPLSPEADFTAQFDFSGILKPASFYFYRFRHGSAVSPIGRTKTLPAPGQRVPIRLGLVACQEYSSGFYGAYTHLARENLDAVLHLGDFIYEYAPDPRFRRERFAGRSFRLPSGATHALSLTDYRRLYQGYRDPEMQAAMAAHPFLVMWDDHEFANDTYWDARQDAPGAPDHPFRNQPDRLRKLRLEANQAWREYVPSRVEGSPQTQLPTYRSFRFGEMLELFLTDTRSFRSPHPCGPDRRVLQSDCNASAPGQSILGTQQKRWLLEGLLGSTARWRGVGSAVMFAPLTGLGYAINLDGWDGYAGERREILEALRSCSNLLVLTGDLHTALAAKISPDFSGSPLLGYEFMAPALTSPGPKESLGSRLPWPGNGLVEKLMPWLEFFDGETNGYAVLEVSEGAVRYELYAVDKTVLGGERRLVRTVEVSA